MFKKYYITGATGFLGRHVIMALAGKKADIFALVMENDPHARELPEWVNVCRGNVCDNASLKDFLTEADEESCLIHCAGVVSVASRPGEKIYKVNVGGTRNILRHAEEKRIGKMVYVSSVHAIPEKPKGTEITEETSFSPELVKGDYAKSKAMATALAFEAAERGLNISIVFPSGIIGPGDTDGSVTYMLRTLSRGRLPMAVKGGYDFVDVRDVAAGIMDCTEKGVPGHGYILSGQYVQLREILETAKEAMHIRRGISYLPVKLAKLVAPLYEKWSLRKKRPLFFTPYAVAVLESNGRFSRRAAAAAFGYQPRDFKSSIRDMVKWIKR